MLNSMPRSASPRHRAFAATGWSRSTCRPSAVQPSPIRISRCPKYRPPASPSPTSRRETPCSFPLHWRGRKPLDARDIFIGVNAVDYSGYPDCRPAFVEAFTKLANLATKTGVEGGRFVIHTPLIELSKAEIIRRGVALGVDYGKTVSCYQPDAKGRACGKCDSCRIRREGFAAAGVPRSHRVSDLTEKPRRGRCAGTRRIEGRGLRRPFRPWHLRDHKRGISGFR